MASNTDSVPVLGFVDRYDQVILHPMTRAQYGDSGYYNVGDWGSLSQSATAPGSAQASDAVAACRALVDRHIAEGQLAAPDLVVLDVGCGLGETTAAFAAAAGPGGRVTGINISATQVAEAQRRHPSLAFAVMDAAALPLPDGSVDRILSVEAVFHFDSRAAFLRRARQVLRPGGRLVYTDVLFTPESAPWDWWVPEINRGLTLGDYPTLCREIGFAVERVEDVTNRTWRAFCAHLRATGRAEAADRIEGWVAQYLFCVLTVPSAT